MTSRNTRPSATHSDIVESELLEILQTLIEARSGLSAIHQLLDEAKTMSDIRTRFSQWQTDQYVVKSEQPSQKLLNEPENRPVYPSDVDLPDRRK